MWQKIEIISKVIAAVGIPIVLLHMSNQLSAENKQRDVETKLIEIATDILSKDVVDQNTESKRLRKWAVDTINAYSIIKMDAETQSALVNRVQLPTAVSLPQQETVWAVVFGADRTLPQAQHEIRVTAPKAGVDGAEIVLRAGFYRSVVRFTDRDQAEAALEKLKAVRDSAYIVDMSTWCSNLVDQKNYQNCEGK